MEILIFILILIAFLLIFVIGTYNSLVQLRNRCENAWAQVDVQLRRRYDLIPNLVETVRGYAKHEKEVFEKVTAARALAIKASTVTEQGQAENQLTSALKSLFAVVENYPELKANQNFLLLQEELAGTESKIAFARQFYNDSVMKYNIRLQVFPARLIAQWFSFKPKEYFEIEEEAVREPVRVSF